MEGQRTMGIQYGWPCTNAWTSQQQKLILQSIDNISFTPSNPRVIVIL